MLLLFHPYGAQSPCQELGLRGKPARTCIMKMAEREQLCMAARMRSHAKSEPSTPRYSLMAALSSGVALQGAPRRWGGG